ncbi:hypothetical protein Lal_00038364 [Lupinus albus]|nr:hypothetical protein Lal_00038364 [Lupinus albus]
MRQEREKMRQEREELHLRLELNEIRTKNTEKMLAAIATKLGISKGATSVGDGSENEGEVESHKTHQNHDRWRKLEIPIFLGEDAYGWVHKLERYFTLKAISEKERMQATMVALEGKALSWYQWWERCNPSPTWESFKIAVDPDFVMGIFLNGLKEEIRIKVMLYEFETLPEVIQKAILIEQKNVIVEKRSTEGYATTAGPYRNNTCNRVVSLDSSTSSNNKREWSSVVSMAGASRTVQEAESSKNMGEYMRLTSAEMKEKREKGLCFRCDEPFTRDHICKNKQLRTIILAEEEKAEKEGEAEEDMEIFNSLQLSLYSMKGLTSTKSWKIGETLEDKPAVIMIDCGASHNFISKDLVDSLQLRVEETKAYIVKMGNGHKVKCQGKCAQLRFYMQQLEVIPDFFLFGLRRVDLVLELKWLASLREVKIDFGRMKLTLKRGDSVITITGDPTLNRTKLSYGAFMQVLLEERRGLRLHYDTGQSYRQEGEGILAELKGTLQQYQDVFQNPQGLPPWRQDHAIHLKNGAWFNSNYNSSTGMSPFRALYDRESPTLSKAAAIQDKFLNFPLEDKLILLGGSIDKIKPSIKNAWKLKEEKRLLHIVDRELTDYDEIEVYRFIMVALLCTQAASQHRPSMNQVLQMLSKEVHINEKALTEPGIYRWHSSAKMGTSLNDSSSSSSSQVMKHNKHENLYATSTNFSGTDIVTEMIPR